MSTFLDYILRGRYAKDRKLCDAESGQERATLSGHSAAVISVSFSPVGKTLASVSADQTIKLWEEASGKSRSGLKLRVQ